MSDSFKCLLTTVDKVERIPETERLFRVFIKGWIFVCSANEFIANGLFPEDRSQDQPMAPYKTGDRVIYIQPDSVLNERLIRFAFPEGMAGKIKPDSLEMHRIKTIKIRKNISEGLLLDPKKLEKEYPELAKANLEDDVKAILGIVKYEPSAKDMPRNMTAEGKVKNPLFKEYISLNNIKYYPDLFLEDEPVFISEKMHGSSVRMGILPAFPGPIFKVQKSKKPLFRLFGRNVYRVEFYKKNLILKFKKLMGLPLGNEFCVGSRTVEISLKGYRNGYYPTDIYTRIAKQENIESKLKPGEELFGEIVGHGVQGHYTYGCSPGELKFFAYDVFDHNQNRWLDPEEFIDFCYERGIEHVPVLNKEGKAIDKTLVKMFKPIFVPFSQDLINKVILGDSTIGGQKIREGVVVKSAKDEKDHRIGRKVLKCISPDYLTQKNTPSEWH